MRFRFKSLVVACAVTTTIGLASATRAEATLILAGTIDGDEFCAVDNNLFVCTHGTVYLDADPDLGDLSVFGIAEGGVVITLESATADAGAGTAPDIITQSAVNIENTSGATVSGTLAVGATDFIGPANRVRSTGSVTWSLADTSTATMEWYDDPTNEQGAETPDDRPGTLVHTFSDTAVGDVDSGSTDSGVEVLVPPDLALFSMTLGFDFTLVSGGTITSKGMNETKTFVPEPASLALFGLAFSGLGMVMRRRRRS